MKTYLIIAFIALGILFSPTPILSITYTCTGAEAFPVYYASPFVYKSTSLATSLAYDYYVLGFIGSWLVWSLALGVVWYFLNKFLVRQDSKLLTNIYSVVIGIAIFFGVMSVIFTMQTTAGSGVEWSIDLAKEAKEWGMTCQGEFSFTAR